MVYKIDEEYFDRLKVLVADGDKEATNELYRLSYDILRSTIFKYITYDDYDDSLYYKDSLIGESFMTTIKNKEELRTMSIQLYVWRLKSDCEQRGKKHVRDYYAKKRVWYRSSVQYFGNPFIFVDLLNEEINEKYIDDHLENEYINKEESKDLIDLINAYPIQEARDILIYKLQGYKNKEIANKLNATYSHILYVMVEFRKYIKNNYMKGGYVDGC